jgi:adenylate cyclase class 2
VIEVEAKFVSPGNDKVEKALLRLGGRLVFDGVMEDTYFRHPGRDFGKTDEALRLRKTAEGAELTYKGPRMRSEAAKAREELTLKTDSPLTVQRILERLGFKDAYTVRKMRKSYIVDKLRVEVDDVDGLGQYVELEVLTESPERTLSLMTTTKAELGLEKPEPKTYLELIISKSDAHR